MQQFQDKHFYAIDAMLSRGAQRLLPGNDYARYLIIKEIVEAWENIKDETLLLRNDERSKLPD